MEITQIEKIRKCDKQLHAPGQKAIFDYSCKAIIEPSENPP